MVLKSKNPDNHQLSHGNSQRRTFIIAILALAFSLNCSAASARNNSPAKDLDPSKPLLSQSDLPNIRTGNRQKRQNPTPPNPPEGPTFRPLNSNVDEDNLAPVLDQNNTGLPMGVWQGMDPATLEKLFSKIDMPPRSPTLNRLWVRFLTAQNSGNAVGRDTGLKIIRMEALYRSGHLREILSMPSDQKADQATRHMVSFITSKAELGLGDAKSACQRLQNAGPAGKGMAKALALELLKMTIYCRAQSGDLAGANLVIDLAREQGIDTAYAYKAVYALEQGRKTGPKLPPDFGLIDYKFSRLFKREQNNASIAKAGAPVLVAMLNGGNQPSPFYLRVAEQALRLNIIKPEKVAEIYQQTNFTSDELNNPRSAMRRYQNRPEGRALLYRATQYERDPVRRAEYIRELMKNARTGGLYFHTAKLLRPTLDKIPQTSALAWFAESAIEISLASGQYEKALSWAVFGSADEAASPRNLLNWLTLIDIGAPEVTVPNGAGLSTTEEAALRGQFSPDTLHRLVTVLDALEYDVPIRLWNRASSAPQPKTGQLPETGVLTELAAASRNQQYGKVILYSIIALGAGGPERAHMIALGDTIKAMSASGMQDDARNIALESLYSIWPRLASY